MQRDLLIFLLSREWVTLFQVGSAERKLLQLSYFWFSRITVSVRRRRKFRVNSGFCSFSCEQKWVVVQQRKMRLPLYLCLGVRDQVMTVVSQNVEEVRRVMLVLSEVLSWEIVQQWNVCLGDSHASHSGLYKVVRLSFLASSSPCNHRHKRLHIIHGACGSNPILCTLYDHQEAAPAVDIRDNVDQSAQSQH